MKRFKRSTVIPIAMLAYLAIMAYIGRSYFLNGEYLFYFSVIGATLVVIVLLHFALKRKEKLRQERESDLKRKDEEKE